MSLHIIEAENVTGRDLTARHDATLAPFGVCGPFRLPAGDGTVEACQACQANVCKGSLRFSKRTGTLWHGLKRARPS